MSSSQFYWPISLHKTEVREGEQSAFEDSKHYCAPWDAGSSPSEHWYMQAIAWKRQVRWGFKKTCSDFISLKPNGNDACQWFTWLEDNRTRQFCA